MAENTVGATPASEARNDENSPIPFSTTELADSADALIDHGAAIRYWNSVDSNVNGMLGGYPHVSRIDLQGSSNFLAKLRMRSISHPKTQSLPRVVDCGAGIGRITFGFLSKVAKVVDVVEPVKKFTDTMAEEEEYQTLKEKGVMGDIYNVGLENWTPCHHYDLIWNQWCLGHLTDGQLVEYLERCKAALTPGGWIVVKENMNTDPRGGDAFDKEDNSVTREDKKFRRIFARCHLKVVVTETQRGLPRELFPVRMYALQPGG